MMSWPLSLFTFSFISFHSIEIYCWKSFWKKCLKWISCWVHIAPNDEVTRREILHVIYLYCRPLSILLWLVGAINLYYYLSIALNHDEWKSYLFIFNNEKYVVKFHSDIFDTEWGQNISTKRGQTQIRRLKIHTKIFIFFFRKLSSIVFRLFCRCFIDELRIVFSQLNFSLCYWLKLMANDNLVKV